MHRNTPTPTDVRTSWLMAVTSPDMDSMMGAMATSVMAWSQFTIRVVSRDEYKD